MGFSAQTIIQVVLVYLCVAVVAAGIAYLGNQLGRLIGKRKMSLMRLRPRHTSNLVTACTGAVIAVITLTIFAFLSEPVRGLLTGVERLRAEEASLQDKVDNLRRTLEEGTFVWKIDEPIVHVTIPSGLPYERIRPMLTSVLAAANSRTILKNNEIAKIKGDQPLPADEIIIDYDAALVEQMANELTQSQGVMGLRIVAGANCLYRRKSPVRLEAWRVNCVFTANEVIARQEIGTRQPLLDLLKFFEVIKQKAQHKGMRPIDGDLGSGMTSAEVDRIQEDIRRQTGRFELIARAKRDLYETSSLDVDIEVRPLEPEYYDGYDSQW